MEDFPLEDREVLINDELEKVNKWLKLNKLAVNVDKTKSMLFHKRRPVIPIQFLMNNRVIDVVQHFNYLGIMLDAYLLLVWGSKIENGHPLHLLEKKALRIVANQDYIAHSESICKALNLVKVPDMYTCAVWNFYYKLMNNLLPIYFENCKPILPRIDQLYNVRKSVFHLPKIKHKFAEQLPDYQLVNY